jgi:hypothetical protein
MIMKKHIEKIENIHCTNIDNLTIDKLGHFNLFCGKYENGQYDIFNSIAGRTDDVKIIDEILFSTHYSELHKEIRFYFNNIKKYSQQIFATTQRLDVIQAFVEVAKEYPNIEAYYYRLGRSAIPKDNNRSVVSMYTADELIKAISKNREVR